MIATSTHQWIVPRVMTSSTVSVCRGMGTDLSMSANANGSVSGAQPNAAKRVTG